MTQKINYKLEVNKGQNIPLFSQFIDNVRRNLVTREFRRSRILDLCGTSGKFGYDLLNTGKFSGSYINLDGSPQMIDISKEFGKCFPGRHISILGGFMSGWVDQSGVEVKEFDTKGKYFDVVLEILGFKYFAKGYEAVIIEIKKSMCPQGVAIFCDYHYDLNAFRALLKKHFIYVKEVYKTGNFAGFACSNALFRWKMDEKLTENIYNALPQVAALND